MKLSDLTVDWLKNNHYNAYFFGLGFVQVKIDDQRRVHFYHPDLRAFVDNPHDHRYNFISKVLRGRLINEIWEEYEPEIPASITTDIFAKIGYASCQKDGADIEVPEPYDACIDYVGEFSVNEGSSYYISRNSFHKVNPDFSLGPCVTFITRGPVQKDFARVLQLPSYKEDCPFSKEIKDDELWQIVRECLSI